MARRYDSYAVRNRVLSTSVRLFLERGYHGTTMAAILKEADVSSSSFQNVFGNKDGVMYELMKLMFSEQFSAADSAAALLGPNASPAFAYALETSVQLTIAELSEIIRDLYLQAYASERSLEYIRRNTAKHLQKFFQQYNPSFDEEDFYQMDIGTSGLMLGFMLRPCDDDFPLDVKNRALSADEPFCAECAGRRAHNHHRGHKTARFAFHCKGCRETAFRCAVRHFRS